MAAVLQLHNTSAVILVPKVPISSQVTPDAGVTLHIILGMFDLSQPGYNPCISWVVTW